MRALNYKGIPPSMEAERDDPALPEAPAPREMTVRALLMGCCIGVVLAAGNVYIGLKTGFIDGGSITAALVGFAFFATFKRLGRLPYSALEANITQTTAASAAIMSFAVGIPGPIPALSLMGHDYPGWALVLWGTGLGVIGILVAAMLRRKLIVVDALSFPTGSATAEVIETIYTARHTALRRAWLLIGTAAVTMAVTWLRDGRPQVIPQVTMFGTAIAGVSTAALTVGVSWSPLMLSTGMLVGLRSAASMGLGGFLAWVVVAPRLYQSGLVRTANFGGFAAWLVWPALGLLTAGSMLPLLLDWRSFVRSFRDLTSLVRGRRRGNADDEQAGGPGPAPDGLRHGKILLLVSAIAMIWVGRAVFGLHPLVTLSTLVLAVLFANVTARAAGETDIAPTGQVGMLTQLTFAGYGPIVSLFAGSISNGEGAQTAQTLWALKAGHRLHASARAQLWAQLLGAVLGAVVVVPVYFVMVKSYGIGTEAMPASSAMSWKATAEAVRAGFAAMPRYGLLAGGIAAVAGGILAALGRTRIGHLVPSPAAMGVAVLMPAYLTFAAFAGCLVLIALRRLRPQVSENTILSVAAGGIAGEAVMGVIVAILIAGGLL